jgi:mono/diheme cytochrome c family protein
MITAQEREACFPILRFVLLIVFATFSASASAASAPSVRRGKTFAAVNCSQCHSIDLHTRSRLNTAPPFRSLHKRYPVETLGDALIEGLSIGHPRMPEFRLDPAEVRDFIAFLKSLE